MFYVLYIEAITLIDYIVTENKLSRRRSLCKIIYCMYWVSTTATGHQMYYQYQKYLPGDPQAAEAKCWKCLTQYHCIP